MTVNMAGDRSDNSSTVDKTAARTVEGLVGHFLFHVSIYLAKQAILLYFRFSLIVTMHPVAPFIPTTQAAVVLLP